MQNISFTLSPEKLMLLRQDLDAIYKNAKENLSSHDISHLKKFIWLSRIFTIAGLAIGLLSVNFVAMILISLGNFCRWTMIAHHITHRGYDHVPDVADKYKSLFFAKGWRRAIDWFDWIYPAAWNIEHNVLHHYSLNEFRDPDLVVENIPKYFKTTAPKWQRVLTFIFFAISWKFFYYAPSTWKQYLLKNNKDKNNKRNSRISTKNIFDYYGKPFKNWKFYTHCILPYASVNFILLPSLAAIIFGATIGKFLFINLLLAEVLTNLHSFAVIVTNHAGPDLYRFNTPAKSKDEFYLRQILGSVNFKTGGDLNDFLHGWLNYQIEHHLFPDLSLLQYQKIQPQVKMICEKHGIPYCQQSVFNRIKVLFDVYANQKTSMKNYQITESEMKI